MPEVTKAIAQSKLSDNQLDTLIDVCVLMHQRYEGFSDLLLHTVEANYFSVSVLSEQAKKRNILRMLTELYFRGLLREYKRIFKLLNQLIQVDCDKDGVDAFSNAMLIITDYIKVYGERIFGVHPRDHKEDIANDFEVALSPEDRHDYLKAQTRQDVVKYLTQTYYTQKCLTHLKNVYSLVK